MKPIMLAMVALVSGSCVVHADAGETNSTGASTTAKPEVTAPNQSGVTNVVVKVTVDQSGPSSLQTTAPVAPLTKAPPTEAKRLLSLFDPFAPLPPEPKTPWRERTGWAEAADKNSSMTPEAVRHQAQFGVVVAGR